MLDQTTDFVSLKAIFVAVLAAGFVFLWLRSRRDEQEIRKRGGHAPFFKDTGLLGNKFARLGVAASARNENIEFWNEALGRASHPNNTTAEVMVGGQRLVFTIDPENIKAILAAQFNEFGKGPRFHQTWHEFLGDSIFATDGETWHNSRQLLRPQFVRDRVSDLDTFEKHVSELIPLLGGQGQTVEVDDLFLKYTLDAATDFLLGRSVDSLKDGKSEFARAFAEVQRLQNGFARAGPFNVLMSRVKFRQDLKVINNFVEPFIEDTLQLSAEELQQRSKSDHGYTFLHALATYTRDRKVLRDQLVATLLAGRDTTACTLSWLFYELSGNPEIVRLLRREIEDVVGFSRAPTYSDLKNMKMLQHTMNETLRLYPVVPFNVRAALTNTSLPRGGGPDGRGRIGVLTDTQIVYSTHMLHLTRSHYPETGPAFADPLRFEPRRWAGWQPRPWTYIPFNGGPRICVGQQFALTEMGYTVVRVLQRFARIERRLPGHPALAGVDGPNGAAGVPGSDPTYETMAAQFCKDRPIAMKSEIVLQPASAVKLAFWEK